MQRHDNTASVVQSLSAYQKYPTMPPEVDSVGVKCHRTYGEGPDMRWEQNNNNLERGE